MSKAWRWVFAIVLVALALTACSDDDGGELDTASESASEGETDDTEPTDDTGASKDSDSESTVAEESDPQPVPGKLGEQLDGVVDDLDDEQRSCIEGAPDPAEAAATCVTREQLAGQVLGFLESSPFLEGASPEDLDALDLCLVEGFEALDDDQLNELAAQGPAAMTALTDELLRCLEETVGG